MLDIIPYTISLLLKGRGRRRARTLPTLLEQALQTLPEKPATQQLTVFVPIHSSVRQTRSALRASSPGSWVTLRGSITLHRLLRISPTQYSPTALPRGKHFIIYFESTYSNKIYKASSKAPLILGGMRLLEQQLWVVLAWDTVCIARKIMTI